MPSTHREDEHHIAGMKYGESSIVEVVVKVKDGKDLSKLVEGLMVVEVGTLGRRHLGAAASASSLHVEICLKDLPDNDAQR